MENGMNSTAKEICAIIDDKMASVSSTFSSDVLNRIYQEVISQFSSGFQNFSIGPLNIAFEYIADNEDEKYVPKWDISYDRTSSDSIVKTWFENAIPLMEDMAANGKTVFPFGYILFIKCEADAEGKYKLTIHPGVKLRRAARHAFHPYERT